MVVYWWMNQKVLKKQPQRTWLKEIIDLMKIRSFSWRIKKTSPVLLQPIEILLRLRCSRAASLIAKFHLSALKVKESLNLQSIFVKVDLKVRVNQSVVLLMSLNSFVSVDSYSIIDNRGLFKALHSCRSIIEAEPSFSTAGPVLSYNAPRLTTNHLNACDCWASFYNVSHDVRGVT